MTRRPVRGTGSLHLALRQTVTDRVAVVAVALIVLACSLLAAAVPRAMDRVLTDGLRQAVGESTAAQRDLAVRGFASPPMQPGDDPLAPTRQLVEDLRAGLPPLLRAQTTAPQYRVGYESLGAGVLTPVVADPIGVMDWEVATLSDLDTRVRYVDGRAPEQITTTELVDAGQSGAVGGFADDPPTTERSVAEVALSTRAAEVAGVGVGSTVELRGNLALKVVGVFEPVDADDPYWGWSEHVLRPTVVVDPGQGDIYQPVALAAERTWPGIERQIAYTRNAGLLLRIPVNGEGLQAAETSQLLAAVRQATTEPHEAPMRTLEGLLFWPPLEQFRIGTSLDRVLVGQLHAQSSSTALVSLVVSGLLGVALAVLALAARLVVERRRRHLALAVARGASPRQVGGVMAAEGLVIGLPASAVGALLAAVVVGGRPGLWGIVLPLVLGLAPAVLLPVLARPAGLRAVRRDVTGRRARRFRLALEGLVALGAVGALVLLRRRGLDGGGFDVVGGVVTLGDADQVPEVGVDPLLAAAPVLLALALALLLVRVYPRPVAAMANVAARRRGAVPFLGSARAGRDAAAGTLPLVVLLLALSTSVFGAVVASTSDRGTDDAAWQLLGAPARATGIGFSADQLADAAEVPGVAALAGVGSTGGEVRTERRRLDVTVAGVDVAALADVQQSEPGAVPLGALGQEPDGAVPVLVSGAGVEVGETMTLTVASRDVPAVVVATTDRVPGVPSSRPVVLGDRTALQDAGLRLPVPSAALMRLGDGADVEAVADAVIRALDTSAPLVTRADVVDRVRGQPLVAGTLDAFAIASVVAAALSGLAVVLTLVVSAPDRTRLLSRLRTLGLSQRQARWLVVWEVAPLAATALVAGAVTGVLVSWWLVPTVDLRAFTGGAEQPGLTVEWPVVVAILAAFAVVTAVFLAVAVAANRRLRLGAVLRVGEES